MTTVETGGLPETLPIFPLAGVLLLPGAELPLNIFEPRYLAMTRDAMDGAQMIGMVQPRDPARQSELKPPVYDVGCVGQITAFEETDDGRYLITLTGLCRFGIAEELPLSPTEYRRVQASYAAFADDLDAPNGDPVERDRLLATLNGYFERCGFSVDWDVIEGLPTTSLVTALAMVCPFAASEKQALLEARDARERATTLVTLMEMSAAEGVASENLQ